MVIENSLAISLEYCFGRHIGSGGLREEMKMSSHVSAVGIVTFLSSALVHVYSCESTVGAHLGACTT